MMGGLIPYYQKPRGYADFRLRGIPVVVVNDAYGGYIAHPSRVFAIVDISKGPQVWGLYCV